MKKLFLYFLPLVLLSGCATYDDDENVSVSSLSVKFMEPTDWNGKIIPPHQACRADGGKGNTPTLIVKGIPERTNLLIMEINDLDNPALSENGGLGSVGFYHNGEPSAVLLPVPGETNELPGFAFKEKSSRVRKARPYPYTPPCIEKKHLYSVTIKAVKRTGSFDKQKTVLLGEGDIKLGVY
ncbi:MAG: hypothetical protein J5787_06425 [Alphaproteobacteria bacterium]|nr:hypothetical protein [Alphaproteobacteria bacterium]